MVSRDPGQEHRASTPLELLFDLTFVVAVAYAASELHHAVAAGEPGQGVLSYLMVFFAIWWAWLNFSWFASAYGTDDIRYRLLVFVQIAGALVVAAGVPRAFASSDFSVVVIGHVLLRLSMVVQWWSAAVGDVARRRIAHRYVAGITVVQVGWIAILLVPADAVLVAFFVLVAAELVVPVWAERAGPTKPWHGGHIAERYSLFTLIVIGEAVAASVGAVQGAVSGHGISVRVLTLAIGGLGLFFACWWTYFDMPFAAGLSTRPVRSFGWGYVHYLVFASLAAVGSGLEVAVELDEGGAEAVSGRTAALAVAVPVAVFLLALAAIGPSALGSPLARGDGRRPGRRGRAGGVGARPGLARTGGRGGRAQRRGRCRGRGAASEPGLRSDAGRRGRAVPIRVGGWLHHEPPYPEGGPRLRVRRRHRPAGVGRRRRRRARR